MTSPEEESAQPTPPLQPFTMPTQPASPEGGPTPPPAAPQAGGAVAPPAWGPAQPGAAPRSWAAPGQPGPAPGQPYVQPGAPAPGYGSPYAGYQPYPGAGAAQPLRQKDPTLAEWWRRLLARIIDGFVILAVLSPLWIAAATSFYHRIQGLAAQYPNGGGPGAQAAFNNAIAQFVGSFVVLGLVSAGVTFAYDLVQHALWGQTLGKRALGTQVVQVATRGPIGWGPAAGRAAVYALAPLVPTIGSFFALLNELWLLWDSQRQCLHDKAARTIVVKKDALPPAS